MARLATACLIGALLAGGVAISLLPAPSSSQPVVRLSVTLPDDARLVNGALPALVLSPRGTHLVYVAEHAGDTWLYLRQLDAFAIGPIPGTEGAMSPFFSPDGQWVAFGADGKLKKVSITGGQPIVLADAAVLLGGTWGEDGTIVFAGADVGMSRVSSAGGPVTVATTIDAHAGEGGHLWPELLPDGKSMLLTVGTIGTNMERARIVLHSLTSGTRRTLIEGGTNPHYVASGHIVYSAAGSLMAAPFDLATGTVTGTSVPVLDGVARSELGVAQVAVSGSGLLAYVSGGERRPSRALVWMDRKGTVTPFPLPPRPYWSPRLSPDGRRIAVGIEGPTHDVWVSEVERDTLARVTYGSDNYLPLWTPDGTRLIFQSNRTGPWNIFWIPVDRSIPEAHIVKSDHTVIPSSWSSDGQTLLYSETKPGSSDVWMTPLLGQYPPRMFQPTPASETSPAVSPRGGWIAYASNETGRDEIYVQQFPEGGRLRQITTTGGQFPIWSKDGRELFYWSGSGLGVVDVEPGTDFIARTPRQLLTPPFAVVRAPTPYDVTPDGQRFVFIRDETPTSRPAEINVVQGWFEELNRLVPMR
jgi:Tol biopolymer transport system component